MNTYRCELIDVRKTDGHRAFVKLLDDHKGLGGQSGEKCTTSKIKSIDFERGIIITQNSIYLFHLNEF